MKMHAPPHPGLVLEELYLDETEAARAEAASRLGLAEPEIADLLSGKRDVTPALAEALAEVFGTSAALWTDLQQDYDEWRRVTVSPVND